MPFQRLFRPEFLYRPAQAVRAAYQKIAGDPQGYTLCTLPWGSQVLIDVTNDYVGHRVYRHGLTALEACETAFRLLEPGDHAIDAGANQGIVTSAMLRRVAPTGSVISIEMLPSTFQLLQQNIGLWTDAERQSVRVFNVALSDREGKIGVGLSNDFLRNTGVAYVSRDQIPDDHRRSEVKCCRLDSLLEEHDQTIRLMKIDVERHEYPLLVGASHALESGQIRNVLFEDSDAPRTQAKDLLRELGYAIFQVKCHVAGPMLEPVAVNELDGKTTDDSDCYVDFLATLDIDAVSTRFASRGYKCLKSRGGAK